MREAVPYAFSSSRLRGLVASTCLALAGLLASALLIGSPSSQAWSPLSSGSISLTSVSDAANILVQGSAARVAARVTITSGAVDVTVNDGLGWSSFGAVSAGETEVFEGVWTMVRVTATVAGTLGTYANTEDTGTAWSLGSGTITVSGTPVRVYAGTSSLQRGIHVEALGSGVVVRTSSSGSPVIAVESGDGGAGVAFTSEFWLSGSGSVNFNVVEVRNPWSDWIKFEKNSGADMSDPMHEPAPSDNTCHDYEVKNTGTQPIEVERKLSGGAVVKTTVDPGDTLPFNCDMDYVKVNYVESTSGTSKAEMRYRLH